MIAWKNGSVRPRFFFVKIKVTQLAKKYIIFTDFVGTIFSVKNFEFWKIRYFDLFSIFQNNLYKTCLNLTLIDDELLPDILPLNSNQFWQFPITRLGVAVRQRGGLLIILPLKTLHYRPLTQKRSRQPPIFFSFSDSRITKGHLWAVSKKL